MPTPPPTPDTGKPDFPPTEWREGLGDLYYRWFPTQAGKNRGLAYRLFRRQRGKCYCGYLDWTTATYGRVTHKHGCPARRDRWCQSHPERCPS